MIQGDYINSHRKSVEWINGKITTHTNPSLGHYLQKSNTDLGYAEEILVRNRTSGHTTDYFLFYRMLLRDFLLTWKTPYITEATGSQNLIMKVTLGLFTYNT